MREHVRFWGDIVALGLYCGMLGYAIAEGRWSFTFIALGPLLVGLYRTWQRYGPDAAQRQQMADRRRQAELDYEKPGRSPSPGA